MTLHTLRRGTLGAALLASGLLLAGCDEPRSDYLDDAPDFAAPLAFGDAFVVVDRAHEEYLTLRPVAGGVDVEARTPGGEIVSSRIGPDGALELLLAEPPAFERVDPETGELRRFELPAGYDRIETRDDGRFVIATYQPNSSGTSDRALINPNQLTVIDLDAEGDAALRTFALEGSRPTNFTFAPPITLADPATPIHYVAVHSPGYVSLVDLTTDVADDRQRRIPLTDPASGSSITASLVLFNDEDPADPYDATMFLAASGVAELYAVDLLPADPVTGRTLQPAINQIGIGASIQTVTPFRTGGRDLLLVQIASGGRVYVVDPDAGTADPVSIDRTMSQSVVWEQEVNGEIRPQAMFYQSGDTVVFFVDLSVFERQGMGAVRALQLGGRVESVQTTGEGTSLRAIVRYQSGQGLELIDLTTRTLIPIPSTVTLRPFEIVGDRLFAVSTGVERLLGVDLTTQSPFEIDMGRAGQSVTASVEAGALLVEHEDALGSFSVFRLDDIAAGPSDEIVGLGWRGVLDRGEGGR